ncbi:unnamed protein product [Microthlaspi erraticum]|uniref:Knottin scorpion toxin-like domain-containing protein n=1 Tax=Microthlaspi erraticum TaxID=1685480 RepID=A0A6D2J739_9BRAS|nr:unnamed protein product [Microthlaspi erraticum]
MENLRLSTVVFAAVVVCLSVVLLSPIEVEGKSDFLTRRKKCDFPLGICYLWQSNKVCNDRCLSAKSRRGHELFDGRCRPNGATISLVMDCYCCYYDGVTGAEKESM